MEEVTYSNSKVSILFQNFNKNNLGHQRYIWHQSPALPEKNIRAGMLQFLINDVSTEEITFLPNFLNFCSDIVQEFSQYLFPDRIHISVLIGRATPYGIYSTDPDGFSIDEINTLLKNFQIDPKLSPDLETLNINGTVVKLQTLKSIPGVFERVTQRKGNPLIILGLQKQPLDQLLPALLGRFLHGLGHALIADRLDREANEELSQTWAKEFLKKAAISTNNSPNTLLALYKGSSSTLSKNLQMYPINQLCKVAQQATFTSEIREQKDFFSLLKTFEKALYRT